MNLEKIRKKVINKEGAYKLLYPPLFLLSYLYCFITKIRNLLYDLEMIEAKTFPLPVISVGNIVAGGTGKTPLVESLYILLQELGFIPAIVTRGYKGKEKSPAKALPNPEWFGDEASIYALKRYLTIVSKDRAKGIELALKEGANVVILDDGFQHRKVKPTLNLVTIDPFNPFGDGRCLPLGLLREPLSGLKRADAFIITRSNLISPKKLEGLELYLKTFKKPIFRGKQQFKYWINENFQKTTPPTKEINVFCGIGNPGQFVEMLIKMGFKIKNLIVFEDHHKYTEEELKKLSKLQNLVTTEKDLIKLSQFPLRIPLKVPVLMMEVPGLKEYLINNIKNTVKEEEVERNVAPIGISAIKGESFINREN